MAICELTGWMGVLVLLQLTALSDGFGKGAPPNTCWTRYPKHKGQATQTTVCPFQISFSPDTYRPGQDVVVTIQDPTGNRKLSGFMIAAYRQTTDSRYHEFTEEIEGQFTQLPEGTHCFSCFPGFQNLVTHTYPLYVTSVNMTWTAPTVNVGNLTFRATMVMDFDNFWTREMQVLPLDKSVTSVASKQAFETPSLSPLVKATDFSECGSIQSCVYYPRHCTGDNCIAAVSFEYRKSSDDIVVQMYSDEADNYVSVGFSDDKMMGHEETFTCVSQNGQMSVQHGWNPKYYNELLWTGGSLSDLEIKHADGRLQCRFVIPPSSSVYRMNQSAPALSYRNDIYDKEQSWYILLAWGKSMPDSTVISYHKQMPMVSDEKVNIKQVAIHRGSAYHAMVRAHAAVMMIAWIFLGGIVTVVARHFRNWFSEKRVLGTKLWFQIHRELAILVAVLTLIGVLLIFGHYGWEIREKATPHAYVGIAVTVVVGLQIIGGFLRPGPEHNIRPIFNWAHRFLGQSAHILAAATMFLAYNIEYITPNMRLFGYVTLAVWVGVQLVCHLAFELLRWRQKSPSGPDQSGLFLDSFLLGLYIAILACLCIVALLSFLLF